jgi:hypothetical protein
VFKGDSADMCAGKFLLLSMGGQANGQASGNLIYKIGDTQNLLLLEY